MKKGKNLRTRCPLPTIEEENPTLSSLVDMYLHKKHKWKSTEQLVTDKEGLELYLNSLKDLTDFICGEPNESKVPDGKNYKLNGHQRRPLNGKWDVINSMGEKLKDLNGKDFKSFEELIDKVESQKETWFGPTAIYDFSLRFGWHQTPRIEPKEYVYVHSIPEKSAIKLQELGYLKKVSRRIPFKDFPTEMRKKGMTAKDIENFLCIFNEAITKLKK